MVSNAANILICIIEIRTKQEIKQHLDDDQLGFRPGRRTRKLTITFRSFLEERLQLNRDTRIDFIDSEKLFNNFH